MDETMFPHEITLYSAVDEPTAEDITVTVRKNYITILRGVLVDATKAVNIIDSGLRDADSVDLYIPFDVVAIDPADIDNPDPPIKKYVDPVTFWRAEDKSGMWTLKADANNFFVKGIAVESENAPYDLITLKYGGNVHVITSVDELDYGGLKHFEVGGK